MPVKLGEALVKENLITRQQLQESLQYQKRHGGKLGFNLVKLGFVKDEEITQLLSRQYGVPSIDLARFEIDLSVIKLVPAETAQKFQILPLSHVGATLTIAMADPTNVFAMDEIKLVTGYNVEAVVASETAIMESIEKYYGSVHSLQIKEEMDKLNETDDFNGDIEVLEKGSETYQTDSDLGADLKRLRRDRTSGQSSDSEIVVGAVRPSRVAAPPDARLRSMFETSAQALLGNRPLRATFSPPVQAESALSKGELTALEAVGLSTHQWPSEQPDDPLTQSIVDYIALIETSLTAADAARLLRVDVSRIRQRLRERSLFGVEYEGQWRLPRFQFERKHLLPSLAEVVAALPAEVNALEVAEWFLSPNPDLEIEGRETPLSPREWLLRGMPPRRLAELASEL